MKRLIFLILFCLCTTLPAQELPFVEDDQLQSQEVFFSGQLRTNAASYLLAPEDFTALQNYRYTPMGIKGRHGMTVYGADAGYIIPHVKKDGSTVIYYQGAACTFAQVAGDIFKGDVANGIQVYDSSWGALGDDWSGDWLYPNGALVDLSDVLKDYTGFVYLDNTSTYLEAGGMLLTDDEIYIGFMDVPDEIWIDLVPGAVNANNSVMTLEYWKNTAAYVTTGVLTVDGTKTGSITLAQSGQITGLVTTDALASIKYGIPHELYWFKITVDGTLSDDVNIWQIRAKPKTNPPSGYKSVVAFKDRLWLYGDTDNPNIFAYSKRNYPETWNGDDSSILEVGSTQPVSCAIPFYNEMMVFKTTGEVGLIEGYSPATFAYEIISSCSGAVAPRSVVKIETGSTVGSERKVPVVMYLSSDGVRICDGLSTPLRNRGIEAYFDKNDSRFISAADRANAVAWMDYTNNEYHLSIPNSPELVCNVETGKWSTFVRTPTSFTNAVTFFNDNDWLTLAGTAAKIYQLETGTTDDTTAIAYEVESKDHWGGDLTHNYRNFLLMCTQATGAELSLFYALDGVEDYTNHGTISAEKTNHRFCSLSGGLNLVGDAVRWKLTTSDRLELYKYTQHSKPVREIKEKPGDPFVTALVLTIGKNAGAPLLGDFFLSLPAGKEVVIDWGDTNSSTVTGPVTKAEYFNFYGDANAYTITMTGDTRDFTWIQWGDTLSYTFDISIFEEMTGLTGLVGGWCATNAITGDISVLSNLVLLTQLNLQYMLVSGDITDLKTLTALEYLWLHNTSLNYTQGVLPDWINCRIIMNDMGLSQQEVDDFLCDLDTSSGSGGAETLQIDGTNAAPSGVGTSCKTALQGKGWTVNTN